MFNGSMFLIGLLQALLLLMVSPFFAGLARVLRAKMHSRQGPPVFQYYYDILKLRKRQEVRPAYTTWVFRATPYIIMATVLLIAMLLPMGTLASPLGSAGDFIVVVYLFTVIRFFLAVSGLDSGSGFAGTGSIREMGISALVEPTIMLVLFILACFARTTNLGVIGQMIASGKLPYTSPVIWLGMAAFAITSFIEMGKLPFDLAEAEQEIQEGPLTEYSGRSLALIHWGLLMKQVLAAALFLAVFFPFGNAATTDLVAVAAGLALFLLKIACCFCIAAVLENSMARLTIYKAPQLTWFALGIAMLSFIFYLVQV